MARLLRRLNNAIRWRVLRLLRKSADDNTHFNLIIAHLIKGGTRPLIFDVGAHRGESITRYRAIFPFAEIHAFEPDEDNFKIMQTIWGGKSGVFLNNLGVSSTKGQLLFHRNLKSSTSGFHPVNTQSEWARNRSARHNVKPEAFTERSYQVAVTDLDSYIKEKGIERIHLLKIDTQGHEEEVLKGAIRALECGVIDIIESEIMIGDAYLKSAHFRDIENLVVPHGYRFYALDKGGDLLKTPSLNLNAIYVHKSLLS